MARSHRERAIIIFSEGRIKLNRKSHLYLSYLIVVILISACHSNRVYKEDFADNPALWPEFIIEHRHGIKYFSIPDRSDSPSGYVNIDRKGSTLSSYYYGWGLTVALSSIESVETNYDDVNIAVEKFKKEALDKMWAEKKILIKQQNKIVANYYYIPEAWGVIARELDPLNSVIISGSYAYYNSRNKMIQWINNREYLKSTNENDQLDKLARSGDKYHKFNQELVVQEGIIGTEVLPYKTKVIELLPDVKLVELKTACPINWNGRFVVVPMKYFGSPTFAEVLARAKRLGLEFLNETDKEVVKQFAEFRDINLLIDKNDYWLGMKPEIVDKKLTINLVNDQQIGMQSSKIDDSYIYIHSELENFIFKVPKDLNAKILAERLRTNSWRNKTNDNEFASWFVEPKDPPPPVEHRQASRSSEYDGLEDWEIAEIKEAKKGKEIRRGINNAVSLVSTDLQSVKIKSPFAEEEKQTHYRRVDSTLCDMPKK